MAMEEILGPKRFAAVLTCAAIFAAAFLPLPVAAQAYPSKPIRVVVPFPPGGAVDFFARVVQMPLTEMLGQPLIIENKGGASGMIGADAVAKSPPDGYTLLLGNIASLAINVGIYPKMPYDPVKDFTPIIRTVDVNYVLVVNPSLPVKTVPELIAYAKAHPGQLSYGSAGSGSLPHLADELFKATTATDIVHVPYKGGGPMVTDLLGGSVQMTIADQANLMPHVATGKMRALAVSSPRRSTVYPDLPTIAESLPGFEATAWQGLVGPAGMAPDVVRRINEAFAKVMAMPDVRQRLLSAGLDPVGGSPEAFRDFIAAEIVKWSKIAKSVGARAE